MKFFEKIQVIESAVEKVKEGRWLILSTGEIEDPETDKLIKLFQALEHHIGTFKMVVWQTEE